jgi:hypothetical protein
MEVALFVVALDVASSQLRSRGAVSWARVTLLVPVPDFSLLFRFSSLFFLCA